MHFIQQPILDQVVDFTFLCIEDQVADIHVHEVPARKFLHL